jgi:hypothetical protein
VHCNSTPTRNSGSGTQVYYRTPQSIPLASAMRRALIPALELPDGGVRGQSPVAVASPDRPANEDRPFPAPPPDKKALKALAKAQKKALKSKEG